METQNPFDALGLQNLEDAAKQKAIDEEKYNKRDYLIHRVFAQTEAGAELLQTWVDNVIIMKPVVVKGESHDPYDIGIAQGLQDFVRGLYLTCKKVEEGK